MKGACVFVFFMICNAILGLKGIGIIIFGVLSMSLKRRRRLSVELRTLSLNDRLAPFIALMVIGSYITIIFILGAFSKNRRGVLIAYFVLILLVVISNTVMALLVKFLNYFKEIAARSKQQEQAINMTAIVFGVTAGVSFLSFLFAAIYFCIQRKYKDNKLYSVVRNLEYTNLHQV